MLNPLIFVSCVIAGIAIVMVGIFRYEDYRIAKVKKDLRHQWLIEDIPCICGHKE